MDQNYIILKLTELFRTVFNDPEIVLNDQMTANDVGGWDSLAHMILIAEIEETFEIEIKLRELNKMRNVGDIIEIIKEKVLI